MSQDNDIVKREELLVSLRNGRVVIVTGTGVSMYSVGYPKQPHTDVAGWLGLLLNGLDFCKRHDLLGNDNSDVVDLQLKQASARHLIDAAQQINDWLDSKPGNLRFRWLKESVGSLTLHDASLIKAIIDLGGLIATLNYDDLLHKATGRPPLHWKQQTEIDQYLRPGGSKDFILHIHGCWQEPSTVVLDRRSYDEIKKHDGMQFLMRTFARMETLLFVGCGNTFSDPNFKTLMDWSNEALKDAKHRHFVLCREADEKQFYTELKEFGMLEPLVYGTSYSDLVPFLVKLAVDSGRATAVTNPPVTNITQASIPSFQKPVDIWRMQWKR